MRLRIAVAAAIAALFAAALMASNGRRPLFAMPDPHPRAWPTNAADQDVAPPALFNAPCEVGPKAGPIVIPEREA